jgi:3-hydroxyisobutyrate dehydrogenase
MNIAFFGVGNMGRPMASNLVSNGHNVTVFDLDPDLVMASAKDGTEGSDSPEDCVRDAEMVVSMLPSGKAVEGLYLGENKLLEQIPEEALIIDCSTIDVDTTRRLAGEVDKAGRKIIDAPVSGGVGGAKAGTLTFICGGDDKDVERAKPVLECMGKAVFRAGDNGAGQIAKICNNMLLAVHMIGTCEALSLGRDNGIEPEVLSEIMLASSGRNWSLEVYNPWPGVMEKVPSANDYQGGFAVDLMNKDLTLALETALKGKSKTPMGALAKNLYGFHGGQDENGKLDFSSILKMFGDQEK